MALSAYTKTVWVSGSAPAVDKDTLDNLEDQVFDLTENHLAAVADFIAAIETTVSTSYVDLATPGPAVTVLTGTKAIVLIGAQIDNTSANVSLMSVAVSGATTVAADDAHSALTELSVGDGVMFSHAITFGMGGVLPALTPGTNTFTAKYRVVAGTGRWLRRHLVVILP